MITGQKNILREPLLTGSMAASMAKAAFDEAEKDGHLIMVTIVDKSSQALAVTWHHNAGIQ